MAKYTVDDVKQIIGESIARVSQDVNAWADFILQSAYTYKYGFEEQLVINSLRPGATALAAYDVWRGKMNAYVKRGVEGVPFIKTENNRQTVSYLFDISDTSSDYKLWEVSDTPEFKKRLSELYFNADYGDVSLKDIVFYSLDSELRQLNEEIKQDNAVDFTQELESFLFYSVYFPVFKRCNVQPTLSEGYEKDFEYLGKLNTEQLMYIGGKLDKYIRKILTSIEKIAKSYALENSAQIEQDLSATAATRTERSHTQARGGSFTPDQVNIARQTDLVSFLSARGERLKRVGSEYTMEAHDSMRIKENQFFWNSRGIGGNAVNFCMEYYGMDFKGAVAELLMFNGYSVDLEQTHRTQYTPTPAPKQQTEQKQEQPFKPLPYDLDTKNNRVYAYLTKTRELSPEVVNKFIKEGLIAQDIKGNAVFKVFDSEGKLSGAEVSGTLSGRRYKQVTERSGNGFTINPNGAEKPKRIVFFESAIDTLSYYNLHQDTTDLLVSMAGLKDKVVLNTLERYGLDYSAAIISSDNDEAGAAFAEKMKEKYGMNSYRVNDDELSMPFDENEIKDWNDLLKVSEWEYPTVSRPPRRYVANSSGEAQRAWNGKTAEEFTPADMEKFAADTEKVLESVPDEADTDSSTREKTFAEQVDESLNGNLPFYTSLKMGDTPQILLDVGCEQLPMLYTQRHLRNAVKPMDSKNHKHGLTTEQIKRIPELLKTPVMIFDSPNRRDSIIAVTSEFDSVDNPIVVSIKPNGKGRYEVEEIDANFVTSIYGRNNFPEYLKKIVEADDLLYCSKEKSQALFERWGEQYSELTNNLDFNCIIHQSRNIVNPQSQENSEQSQDLGGSEQQNTTQVSVTLNDERNGVELRFSDKPSEEVLDKLKAAGYRWSSKQKMWYAAQEENTLNLAKELQREQPQTEVTQTEQKQADREQPKTDSNIIGNTPYQYVPKKSYRKLPKETALLVADEFDKAEIKYSGKINDDGTLTLTFDGNRLDECSKIIDNTAALAAEAENPVYTAEQLINQGQMFDFAPQNSARNFRITDNNLGVGTPKEKYRRNVEAIKVLKAIETENRSATSEEQELLSRYVGWGSLPDVFDSGKTNWSAEYAELKELLTDEEYSAARASTNNAHYTAPEIIRAIYTALSNMGFTKGKILEPAMGIGNFFGMLPESMQSSKLYGVELDSISGRIAKQLYPNANIQIKGFEKTAFTSNSFDVAIGNVPFGDYNIYDKDFKEGNLIHDYFFKKSLDKVRPGGVIAFITSKGTLDKQSSSVRQYLAERAELIGAIRLPNNAFKANAGTEVTSDIIFLKKREMPIELTAETTPDWVSTTKNENGIELNSYFVNNPEMVLGEMREVSGRYGTETACIPFADKSITELLETAVKNISGSIGENYAQIEQDLSNSNIIPENYRNYCYAVVDGGIYYREGDIMRKQEFTKSKAARMKGMIAISEALRKLITFQKDDYPDEQIRAQQETLNTLYDKFIAKHGLLSSSINRALFRADDTAGLLGSLENLDDDGNLVSKADIFTKRTIVPYRPVESVDTASEALAVSISEKARVDLEYMSKLCSMPIADIVSDLKGIIFENPVTKVYETADEYLSGNVREKLRIAKEAAEKDKKYAVNAAALTEVQPEDLQPSEISARLGSTWIPAEYFQQFMYELLETPQWARADRFYRDKRKDPFSYGNGMSDNTTIMVAYDESTSTYGISNKISGDRGNIKANITYGTSRVNAYKILEDTLNLKTVRVTDIVEDENGNKRSVVNQKETELAQAKQNQIKQAFQEWIFDDYNRAEELCKIYNEKFNSIRPREYDGSHLTFGGINPEIKLRKHQINAIAHTIYGGNTLLAHTVGAGKTFEMVASAMENKRLGLCSKSLICVPKHIVNQFAKEFLQLYPTANILVPDEKDFSKENRQKFCARIATGNYDAIIMSHNQFEKIPLSKEREIDFIRREIDETAQGIEAFKHQQGEKGFSIKQMEGTKKKLAARLEKLINDDKRDTTITFEELGVDRLYVDEAHLFKNLYFNSKMTNVSGINTSSMSQRATDLFMKCRYLDEKTGSRGLCFATGTPISNSMAELYTMQKYLQNDKLKERGLTNFDAWASTFGETVTDFVLAPEGTGFQQKTRFAKFFNLPELMSIFRETADIKTADELELPVPKANYHTISTEASEYQELMVEGLAERADDIRHGRVDPTVDNMLNVTNDGRKLALDQRLLNSDLPEDENSKVNTCAANVYEIWQSSEDSAQMIFCDLSTPHYDGSFNIYDDIKSKLTDKGIPTEQIAFIHDCKNDEQKQALFSKVRDGKVRILLGSTTKMGTGTNCQDRLTALHHIDCPWRPSDLEQRNGRIIRQGNLNSEVDIYNYVTKGTFDAYLYQLVENKQRFISQVMTSKSPVRVAEDVDEAVLNYAQIKAIACGNPLIKEKMDLDMEVSSLRTVFADYQETKRQLQADIAKNYPAKIQELLSTIKLLEKDKELAESTKGDTFRGMTVNGTVYSDKKEAGEAFKRACYAAKPYLNNTLIGEYRGFKLLANFNKATNVYMVTIKGFGSRTIDIGGDVYGNITRLDNALNNIEKRILIAKKNLDDTEKRLETAKKEVERPFPQLKELREKEAKLDELNKLLSADSELPGSSQPSKDDIDLS